MHKKQSLLLTASSISLALGLWACGSDSSSSSNDPDPVIDLGANSLGFLVDASDTLKVNFVGNAMTVDCDCSLAKDSLQVNYRHDGTTDTWAPFSAFSLAQLPLTITFNNPSSLEAVIDLQLILKRADGSSYTADDNLTALNKRVLSPQSSSSTTSSSSSTNGSSSSTVNSSSSAQSSSSGYDVTLSSGNWTGDYGIGIYTLSLQAGGAFTETIVPDAADGKCLDYSGTWTQSAGKLVLTRTLLYSNDKTSGKCPSMLGSAQSLTPQATDYPIVFTRADGTEIYLSVPDLGSFLLDTP